MKIIGEILWVARSGRTFSEAAIFKVRSRCWRGFQQSQGPSGKKEVSQFEELNASVDNRCVYADFPYKCIGPVSGLKCNLINGT